MQTLDWGQVTPEAANTKLNEYHYVYNHDLSTEDKVNRTIRFILGRVNYYDEHLPENPRHNITIDIRGQEIQESTCEHICNTLKELYQRPYALIVQCVK